MENINGVILMSAVADGNSDASAQKSSRHTGAACLCPTDVVFVNVYFGDRQITLIKKHD